MTFSTTRRVEFRDTDAAGIVHFSAFFPMMEAAEHEMLRSLGISILPHSGDSSPEVSAVTWPRVSASCDYVAAARFEDELTISVQVAHIGTSSVQYKIDFSRQGHLVASGTMTAVCCRLAPQGGLEKRPIPDEIRDLLAKHH